MSFTKAISDVHTPQVCVLTPGGRGAIAVVSVSGPGSTEGVDMLFRAASGKRLAKVPVGRLAFGRWGDADGEEVVVARLTRSVEVHCHGGSAASRAVVESLVEAGCRQVDQAEWLEEQTADRIAAAAHRCLGQAITEQSALVLVDQLNGALRVTIENALAEIEAGRIARAAEHLQLLAKRWSVGKRLTAPARVVLTGAPNVGKSSLINALVGYKRAIVFDTPGTTRDVVTATTAIDGWAVELIDTAGLRTAADDLEQAGIEQARSVIATADLGLRVAEADVFLAGEPPASEFDAWLDGKQVIDVANKIDRLDTGQLNELRRLAGERVVLTSAVTPGGAGTLLSAIGKAVVPGNLPTGAAVPFTEEQVERIKAALDYLQTGAHVNAKQSLLALTEASRYPDRHAIRDA